MSFLEGRAKELFCFFFWYAIFQEAKEQSDFLLSFHILKFKQFSQTFTAHQNSLQHSCMVQVCDCSKLSDCE